ncbi:hypothetical protein [Leptolyngbya sp. CCY15150]|uniref:hypothetical protein n=1 Tax=Leptolyngbya sp. CCY15150 TaxID=2767772 RepID=UPI001952452B|nr:hypothetical protein [Leptolyngbya sp. CCY15150]
MSSIILSIAPFFEKGIEHLSRICRLRLGWSRQTTLPSALLPFSLWRILWRIQGDRS